MTYTIRLAAGVFIMAAGSLQAQDVTAPTDVAYGEMGAVEAPLTGAGGDAAKGAEVVSTKSMGNCIACHQISDMPEVPFQGEVGPPLDGVADRWTQAELRGIVANAKMAFPGTIMPAFYKTEGFVRPGDAFTGKAADGPLDPLLTAEQVEDVVAYLMTLKDN